MAPRGLPYRELDDGAQDGILLSVEVSGTDPPLEGLGGGGGGIVRVSEASPPPDVVSGLGLASIEATPDCSQLTQADRVGMSSQSAGNGVPPEGGSSRASTHSTSLLEPLTPAAAEEPALTRTVSAPVTLQSSNAIDYHSARTFVKGSNLHRYLAQKEANSVTLTHRVYSLHQVLVCLRDAMRDGDMFDQKNRSVVVLDSELEYALDVKAVHLSQIRDFVLKQMTEGRVMVDGVWQELLSDSLFIEHDVASRTPGSVTSTTSLILSSSGCEKGNVNKGKTRNPSGGKGKGKVDKMLNGSPKEITVDVNGEYRVRRPFRKVLRTLKEVDKNKNIFSYKELVRLLSQYILVNKDQLFDSRNSMVVVCQGDLLGKAFGIKAFHRSQVTYLLRKQLLSKHKKMDKIIHEDSHRREGRKRSKADATSEEPDSSTGQTLSDKAGKTDFVHSRGVKNGAKRQRRRKSSRSFSLTLEHSDGEEEDVEVIEYHASDDDDEDDEDSSSVSSEVSDLVFKSAESQKSPSSPGEGEDDFEIENVYRLEYDVSSDEEGEPPGAGCSNSPDKKKSNNRRIEDDSCEDSDSDLGEAIIVASVLLDGKDQDTDLAQWADSSSDSDEHDDQGGEQTYEFELSNYDVENGSETWKCVNCGQPNVPYIRYCHRCWQERKGWVPERPKPKRGKRKEKRTGGVAVKGSSMPRQKSSALARSKSDAGMASNSRPTALGDSREEETKDSTSLSEDDSEAEQVISRAVSTNSSDSVGAFSSQDSGLGSQEGSQEDMLAVSGSESSDEASSKAGSSDYKEQEVESVAGNKSVEAHSKALQAMLCTFCCVRPKDACFVHGKISHQVCCYPCAKKLYKQKGSCPVCRRKIEKITKNIMV